MLPRHHESAFCPEGGLAQAGKDVETNLTVGGGRRRDDEVVIGQRGIAFSDGQAVGEPRVGVVEGGEGGEGVEVGQLDDGSFFSLRDGSAEPYVLIDLLCLVVVGMWSAVGSYETVDAEGTVVGLVAEVAAISEVFAFGEV